MDRSEENIEQETTPENESGEEISHPMEAFLEDKSYGLDSPRRGEIRTGTIARITETDILVDIGFKSEGVILERELSHLSEENRAELTIGSELTVYILRTGGTILLSLSRAEEEKDWVDAQSLLESKEMFEGIISGYNKGGLIVKLGGIRGFIPASQVSIARRWRADGESPDQRWGKMVGEPIAAKVIEVERRRNRLILSERAAAREARDTLKKRLISELKPGDERVGYVISLADFGAFVDIGGADGLVHTSEISWKRISHPRDVLKIGQEVEVRVLALDPDQNRISLSIRELLPDPWDSIVEQFQEGQLVEGAITKLTKFGAFASLRGVSDYEVEGLIHISELSDKHIVHPRELVSESETLTLRIIRVDKERRRIGLSLKRVDSPEYAELDWQAAMQGLQADEEASDETGEPEAEVVEAAEVPDDSTPQGEVVSEDDVDVNELGEVEEAEADTPQAEMSELVETAEDKLEEVAEEAAEAEDVITVDEPEVTEDAPEAADVEDEVVDQDEEVADLESAEEVEEPESVNDEAELEAEDVIEEAEADTPEAEMSEPVESAEDKLEEAAEEAAEVEEVIAVDEPGTPEDAPEAADVEDEVVDQDEEVADLESAEEVEEPESVNDEAELEAEDVVEEPDPETQDEAAEVEAESETPLSIEDQVDDSVEITEDKPIEMAEDPALEDEPDAPDEDG
jgi:small subunit ribosomal protein S1